MVLSERPVAATAPTGAGVALPPLGVWNGASAGGRCGRSPANARATLARVRPLIDLRPDRIVQGPVALRGGLIDPLRAALIDG